MYQKKDILKLTQKHKQKSHEKSCDNTFGPSSIIKSRRPVRPINNTAKAVNKATIAI